MISREQIIDACTQALGTPFPTRLWIAALVLLAETVMDEEWKRGAVHRLMESKGKVLYER